MRAVTTGMLGICLSAFLPGCSAQKPAALPQLALQPILYADITQNKLYGAGCNFVAANGGMGAVFLAQGNRGLFKIDDQIVSMPVAPDATALPQGAHTRYAAPLYRATLLPVTGAKHTMMGVVEGFPGHLVIADARHQPIYDAAGDVQCKPM